MPAKTLTIDGKPVSVPDGATLLEAAEAAGIRLPTLCHLEGVYDVGACRLCLVEVAGSPKLLPACTSRVREGMEVRTDTERLARYRRLALELLLAERNHVCAVCVSNGHCELQTLAYEHGIDHVRYAYAFPHWEVDLSHPRFGMDHNRCILCHRCVRVCWHVEGAGTKNVAGRGETCRIISDLARPWGESDSCTSCGKCVMSCPTGALFERGASAGEMEHDREKLEFIVTAREKQQWIP
jgi:bidirectional [NiFe] hydrogenase diaphorase subunit